MRREEATDFFDAYNAAFSRGASAIAEFYAEPCVTARMGAVRVNRTRSDTETLFAEVDKAYRAKGFSQGECLRMDLQPLGANSAFATVHWAYKDVGGATLWETTFSYNLYRRNGAWKILVQTMHDQ